MKQVGFYLGLMIFFACSDDADNQNVQSIDNNTNQLGQGRKVAIPDPAFEQALIDLNYDSELDGQVTKDRIDSVKGLFLDNEGITDLTGIGEFNALETLSIRDNNLIMVDLTRNSDLLFIWAEGNELENINITGLSSLEKLK